MPKNLNEIKTVFENNAYDIEDIIHGLFKKFNFKTICCKSGTSKEQGYSVSTIIILMTILPLLCLKSVSKFFSSKYTNITKMKKDVLYRFKNNSKVAWRNILLLTAKNFLSLTDEANSTSTNSIKARNTNTKAFILDDTIDCKTGRKIENISYVHDHVGANKGSKLGFKHLVLGYYDGTSIIPLDFTIQKEKELAKKKKKEQYSKNIHKNTHGYKRRKEATKSKITNSLSMVKRAVKKGFKADYVIVDSWFPSHDFIKEIRSIKDGELHVIGGIKRDKRKYFVDGKALNAKEIIEKLKAKGKEKRNRKYNTRYFEITVQYGDLGSVKLFFCRFPRQKTWRLFISTDLNLDMSKFLETYAIRWTIEVMFKEMKQYLCFGKCQSRDFDAHIAQATISCLLFIFLSYLKRKQDYETIGGIFDYIEEDLKEKTIAEKIWHIFEELLEKVISCLTEQGSIDIREFKKSIEYKFIEELFEESFLSNQLKNVA